MTHIQMPNVSDAVRAENLRRHREESLKTEIPVELTCAAYPKDESHYGKFVIRILNEEDVEYLKQL